VKRTVQDDWSPLRLRDRMAPGLRVLFVGINPGVRSARTGHHFAGFSNRFWKLLFQSSLVPEPITFEQDHRLTEWGYGITNLIARPTPGIDDLRPSEYVDGWKILDRKVRKYRPQMLALVGVTVYRAIRPLVAGAPALPKNHPIALGFQRDTIHGARLFVLPNPSGRNANFTYDEMLDAFKMLARALRSRKGFRLR
jgi:double-stranded uracil-DNA glycosylase